MGESVSQATIVEVMRAFRNKHFTDSELFEFLYEHNCTDVFLSLARDNYRWDWLRILIDLRSGKFYFTQHHHRGSDNITGKYLSLPLAQEAGNRLINQLAATAATLSSGESLVRSLQLDGFDVDKSNLTLIPLEGPVSAREEEDILTRLVTSSGILGSATIKKHMADAHSLYTSGKYHPSLNESRNLMQALIDGITSETKTHGTPATKLPSGTKNKIEYLTTAKFFTADEQAAFDSAWGSLSAGSHPGVPEREQARIGLVLALEFGQLLLLKFSSWKIGGYRAFA